MKLSEAISLGHTLIGENRFVFYSVTENCGCAIASAAAALGRQRELPLVGPCGHEWLHGPWPWTAESLEFYQLLRDAQGIYGTPCLSLGAKTASHAISQLHMMGMPRLEIAALIAQIEPPEEPGLAASSHSPAPATVEVA